MLCYLGMKKFRQYFILSKFIRVKKNNMLTTVRYEQMQKFLYPEYPLEHN